MSTPLSQELVEHEFDRHLQQAIKDVQQLYSTLVLEHDALKISDLQAFETLQILKQHQVQTLQLFDALRNQFCTNIGIDKEDPQFIDQLSISQQALWQELVDILEQCDKLHRTSDLFMRTKLQSINKALEILELNNPLTSTSLYNDLGNAFNSNIGRSLDKA